LYADLDIARRADLHRIVGEALEIKHRADLGPALPALANHFLAAAEEQCERAIEYARLAGERALDLLAYEDAAGYFKRALGLLEGQEEHGDQRRWRLLMGLAAATRRAGDGEAAVAALRRAATEARRLGSPERLASAALSFPPGVTAGVVDPERVALLEEAVAGLGGEESPLRARVMACLAWELFWGDTPERCDMLSREAVAMARRNGDELTLAFTLNARRYATWGMENIEESLAAATELLHLASRSRDRELVMEGHHWRVIDLLVLGDIGAVDREIEAHGRVAVELRQPRYLWWSAMWRANRATMSGRFSEAERLANEAVAIGQRVLSANAALTFQTQLLLVSREQGRLAEMATGFQEWMRVQPAVGAPIRCGLAQIFSELGREPEAHAEFEHLAAANFSGLGSTDARSALAALAETCAFLGDSVRASVILERLEPYAGRNVVIGPAIGCYGPVDRFRGLLATTMHRWDEAEAYFTAALDLAVRMAAPPFVARTQHDYAAMLVARGNPKDYARARDLLDAAIATARRLEMARVAERAEALFERIPSSRSTTTRPAGEQSFRREGNSWTIVFDGSQAQIKDAEGLRYLAQLLASPERPFYVLELVARAHSRRSGHVAPVGAASSEAALADAGLRFARLGDAGAVLDQQAKAAYQRSLIELEAELDDAYAANDIGRGECLRAEYEFLVAELSGALGLNGRSRRAADVGERARTSVTRALHRALARIRASHPSLGQHLTSTVRTGTFCVYSPDPRVPIAWTVSANG
jgi:tetratricopeptide (TPR) repeat protein